MSDNRKTKTTNPLNDFQEGQWWIFELDNLVNPTNEQKRAVAVVHNMLRSAEQSSKEIERLNALVAMQAEALKRAIPFIGYGQTVPHLVEKAEQALSASSETVEAWKAKMLEPLQRQVAMLRSLLDKLEYNEFGAKRCPDEDDVNNALSNTQAAAEAYSREHAAKVLEEAAGKFSSVEGYTKNIRVEISGWLELQAANKKEGE